MSKPFVGEFLVSQDGMGIKMKPSITHDIMALMDAAQWSVIMDYINTDHHFHKGATHGSNICLDS